MPIAQLAESHGNDIGEHPAKCAVSPRRFPKTSETWRKRLAEHSTDLKVGLVWAGNRNHKNDRNRSIKLASLAPLAQVPGVRFFSLQKGEAATQANSPPPGMALIRLQRTN